MFKVLIIAFCILVFNGCSTCKSESDDTISEVVDKYVNKDVYYYSNDYVFFSCKDSLAIKGFDFRLDAQEKSFGDIEFSYNSENILIRLDDSTSCAIKFCLIDEINRVIEENFSNDFGKDYITLIFSDSLANNMKFIDLMSYLQDAVKLSHNRGLDVPVFKIVTEKYLPERPG